MKLHSLPLSPFAARVRVAIYARELPVEIVLAEPEWRTSEAFARLNPLRRIPVLETDDGGGIPESGVILEFLEDAFDQRPLLPRTPQAAAQVRLLCALLAEAQSALQQVLYGLTPAGFDPAVGGAALVELDGALGRLEPLIGDAGYMSGGELTLADAYAVPLRFMLEPLSAMTGRPELLSAYPRLHGYAATMQAEPALRRVRDELATALASFMASWQATGDPDAASRAAASAA